MSNPLLFSRIKFKFTFCIAISFWNPYLFCEFTFNSLSSSRFHFEFTIFFANSLLIHFLHRESTWSSCLFREFNSNSLLFSRIHFQPTSISRINFWFPIFFANSLSIYYLFREFTANSQLVSRFHFEFTMGLPAGYFFNQAVKTIWLERPWSIKLSTISLLPIFDH